MAILRGRPDLAVAAGRGKAPVPIYLFAAGWVALAIAVLALDRRAFEGATPEAPGTPPAR
jgi:hypothetical protein